MGTRHLTMVRLDGIYRVAQYGQCDGGPQEAGREILNFLRRMDRPLFERKLRAARFFAPGERKLLGLKIDSFGLGDHHDSDDQFQSVYPLQEGMRDAKRVFSKAFRAAIRAFVAEAEALDMVPESSWENAVDALRHETFRLECQYQWRQFWPELTRDTGAEILGAICDLPDGIRLVDDSAFIAEADCEWAYLIDLDNAELFVLGDIEKCPARLAAKPIHSQGEDHLTLIARWPFAALPNDAEMAMIGVPSDEDDPAAWLIHVLR